MYAYERFAARPTLDIDFLANTAIQISCYDRNGDEVKRVTSSDPGTIEDPEQENTNTGGGNNEGGGGQSGDDDLVNKGCPGFDARTEYANLRSLILEQ